MRFITASEPEFMNRTRSKDGTRAVSSSASWISTSVAIAMPVPSANCLPTASTTGG